MRVAVVGAGVGGLAVSARLAARGHRVVLLEAQDAVGGKLGEEQWQGFRFDTGPSLLTLPHVLEDLFDATGGWPAGLVLRRLDPLVQVRFADGSLLDLAADLDEQCRRVEALRPGNGEQWRAFHDRARRIWEASREPFLESPLSGPRGLAALALRHPGQVRVLAPGRSLRGLARRYLDDPRLVTVVDRYATYTGSDARRAPAALAAVVHAETAYGGWYVEGGLRRLADALLQRCLDLGVEVRTGARVVRVPRPVAGVRLADGTTVPADVVVADADAAHVYGDLVDCPQALRRLRRAEPSLSGFALLLALRGRTEGLGHHTVLFPRSYDAELDAVFRTGEPVEEPTLYVSNPPDVAPDGGEAWFVLVNAPRHGSVDWRAAADGYREHLLDLLAARGLDVRARLLWSRAISPADLEERTGAVGGAIYGSSSNGTRAAFLRPANRSPVPGLFLVGGSAHPGGGLPLVALSAAIVSDLVGPA